MDQSSLLGGREAMTTLGKWFGLHCCQLAFITVAGCSMYQGGARNTFGENIARANTNLICIRDHIVAKEVWEKIASSEPDQNYSKDYAEGFRAGFADYLKEGGITIPPSLPPYRYWLVNHQHVENLAAVDDWYAGYQRGARMAHDSPLRDLAVVPTIAVLPPSKDTVRIADVDYSGNKAGSSIRTLGDSATTAPSR
jgi:hypothetical protein